MVGEFETFNAHWVDRLKTGVLKGLSHIVVNFTEISADPDQSRQEFRNVLRFMGYTDVDEDRFRLAQLLHFRALERPGSDSKSTVRVQPPLRAG
jgi:hypothetical protein